jgi:aryl-alcohol dehydrogenase-like predicted oxidoreductase
MKYRQLGNSGISVSEIGFGAWGIGGLTEGATSYGRTDDDESRKALEKAYDQGITFFDTSNVYGNGHSEKLIGKTLGDVREKIIIASKVGFLRHNGPQDFSKNYITASLEYSLERLGTDYLDLFQLHSPPPDIFDGNLSVVETLEDLKKGGKIRAYGISAKSPEDAVRAISEYSFDAVQVNFNMVDQRAIESGLFDLCQEKGVGIIGRTPLCFGFLSGDYPGGHEFDPTDHRSTWSENQRKVWGDAYKLFSEAIDKKVEQTDAQLALRFCLSYDIISTVIPGMMNEKEVVENAQASQKGPLSEIEKLKLEEIFSSNVFFLRGNN